jgi:hypothetical protein
MKREILAPILVLSIWITACSPITTNLGTHKLGASIEHETIDVDQHDKKQPTFTILEATSEEDVSPIDPLPTMPIITETHQGFTYRPGQVVTVLGEGFDEGDTLVVTLIHETQGQINTFSVSPISSLGNIPVYLPVEIAEANRYPDGEYTLIVSGSDRTQKSYTFSLDYLNPAETAPFDGCGVYPEPVLESIVFVWCTGYTPSAAPLDIRGVVNGEELFTDLVDTIYSDGVALYVLDIFDDDPAGEWTLEFGQDELTIDVKGENHE